MAVKTVYRSRPRGVRRFWITRSASRVVAG